MTRPLRAALLALCTALLFASCKEEKPLDLSSPADVGRIYGDKCGRCHVPHAPDAFPMKVWRIQVAKFAPQVGLEGAEREAVLAWLLQRAKDGPPAPTKEEGKAPSAADGAPGR